MNQQQHYGMPPNQMPPNQMPPNQMPPNQMPSNQMPPNQMPPNQMHPQEQQGNYMGQMMSQQPFNNMQPQPQGQMQSQSQMQAQMNQGYQQPHYMSTPQQGSDSQSHLTQPSPQVYTQPSPYNQQHSVGYVPPGSVPPSIQPNTPQQQLNIPQRSVDGRFTSPQSISQRSPMASAMSNQPISQQYQSASQPTPGQPSSNRPTAQQPQPPQFPIDPIGLNRVLIVKELRRSIHEVSQTAALLLSLKFSTDNRGPPSAPSYQALSAGNPGSNNPQTKESRGPPTEEEIQTARERYTYSVQQFLAVADNIEKNYAAIVQAHREYQKYDILSCVKVPNDLSNNPYSDLIHPSLQVMENDSLTLEKAINEINEIAQKVKDAENSSKNDVL